MAAAVAAAAEAGEATTETPRKLADKRRPNKENAREKQRRALEEDALLQDRIREVKEEKLRQRIEAHRAARAARRFSSKRSLPFPLWMRHAARTECRC